jgi:hypothetical protein
MADAVARCSACTRHLGDRYGSGELHEPLAPGTAGKARSDVRGPGVTSGRLGSVGTGKGSVMTRFEAVTLAARGLSTTGLQAWIQDNVVPLVLLGIAIILLWIGGRGDNAGVARRSVGLLVGLVALGIAVSGNGPEIGNFLAGLLIG